MESHWVGGLGIGDGARRTVRNHSVFGLLWASGAAVMLLPLTALGCSGPGAQQAMADSHHIALLSLALTVGWFLAALIAPALRRRVGQKGLLILGVTCVVHPALWLSSQTGDCGYLLRWAALLFLPALALVLGALLRRRKPAGGAV